ncbi:MAG: protein kinase [Thermoanaerobaculia bacterium]|nr:protein kinase [Thermoanaerobaculia bacterium]
MSSAGSVGPFRIGARVGTSVWKAEDTRNGKHVAVKILTKQLPKDAARREALIREVRVAAALYHAFLVPILEVTPAADNLLLVMEFIDAQSISRRMNGEPLARGDFFKLAYQLADAVRFLHTKGITHGNINTDSVLVTPAGQIRLAGMSLTNLSPRAEGSTPAYQQKGADPKSVAYMAPEQITGQTATDPRTDVYSLGVVMYEMSTGKLPYPAVVAADLARAIVEGQLPSPKSANPNIDNSILNILGKSLFKDSFRRFKDAKAVLDEIAKADPEAARFVTQMSSRPVSTVTAAPADTRTSILLIADVANYDEIAATDSGAAARAAARMQQLLGEAVYLFNGQVLDPFGKRLVAELPDIESALEAARKGEFDFSPEQQGETVLPVRLLLHAGTVYNKDGAIAGPAVERGVAVLEHLNPLQLFLSEDFVKIGRGGVRVRDGGARGGMKLYTIPPVEGSRAPIQVSTNELAEIAAEEVIEEAAIEAAAAESATKKSRRGLALVAAAAIAVVVVGGIAMMLLRRPKEAEPVKVVAAAVAPVAPQVQTVVIAPFTVEGNDPGGVLAARGNSIRMAAIDILRTHPSIRLADAPTSKTKNFAATIRAGTAGPEIVPPGTDPAQQPVPLVDAAAGIRFVLEWVTSQTHMQPSTVSASPLALNAYADAIAAAASKDAAKFDIAMKASVTADAGFLAAQVLAMREYARLGKAREASDAARQAIALDPSNVDLARNAARLLLSTGDVAPAFSAYNAILKKSPSDLEALTHVARYSASIADSELFTKALTRLSGTPREMVPVHAPDILVSTGKMQSAISQYYDIESNVKGNSALILKIGRISVLRRSLPIAELELTKLARDSYAYYLLNAYILASQNQRVPAEEQLDLAAAMSEPGDDFWTSAAEVYAMIGANTEVLGALTKAASRKEPTAAYIISNPLFAYLRSDERFRSLQLTLSAQQNEIRAALAQIRL